ncbi:protein inscuteable homolog [Amphibalanus amphitrite]|uniref:protein inscuteable homolog n=1 Tax=Amphibalanus amphitrite TaxID=1232801 RepID=UPI001C91BDEC|nr:protein inscuteable homolog [Amphibalanus amphitrite]
MSAVRPSPLNYSRLRDAALHSPPVKPVFGERRAGALDPAAAGRHSRSDSCLAVRPERAPVYRHPLNGAHVPPQQPPPPQPSHAAAVGISPQQRARRQQQQRGTRRRLFEFGAPQLELEIASVAKMSSITEAPANLWQPLANAGSAADKCFPKSNSTTTCGIENVRAYNSRGIDFFCRSQNLEQKSLLDCQADYKPEARHKLLGSPTSQRSQDSGFSDSGESNCDSQSDEQKRERRVRFEKRSIARTLTKMMRGGSPARRATHSAGDGSLPKPILTTREAASSSTLSVSRSRARAGHTPAKTRLSRCSLQVVEEHRSVSASCADLSLASRTGPLTSSPMRADHVLECSAIERELDSMLERAELPDSQAAIARTPRASLNDTSIDFSPRPALDGRNVTRRTDRRPPQRRWSQLLPAGESAAGTLPRRPRSVWNLEAAAADLQARRFCSLPREQQAHRQHHQPAIRIESVRSPSVRHWLHQTCWEVDVECMNTLQSKSVISDMSHLLALAARNARTNIRDIQVRAKTVSREFASLFTRMEDLDVREVPRIAQTVTERIQNFVREYELSHPDGQSSHVHNLDKLRSLMEKMLEYVKSCGQMNRTFKVDDLVEVLTSLAQAFNHLVDLILGEEVKVLLSSLSPERDVLCLKLGLRSLTSVGLDGGRLCRILAGQGAAARLVSLAAGRRRQVRPQALRALATLCCVSQGIKAFEQADGLRVVTSILTDARSTEEERSECAGVIAQVTSPWVDSIHHVRGISDHVEDIIRELIGLAATTDSVETLLLASAALANLTFLNIGAVRLLLHNGAAKVLVQATRNADTCSLFLKDQVATILANMASVTECHEEVLRSGGLSALLSFLEERPAGGQRAEPAVQAAERVQQKAAIALSRLSVRRSVALEVAESGGLKRLVQLCRDGAERNHSDGVLVACLATLRKMASACGNDVFKDGNGLDLVEPRLLETFLLCSSKQESYV